MNLCFIYKIEKKDVSRTISLIKSRKYLHYCLKGLLINEDNNKLIIKNETKLTVVIPIFNCEKTIKSSIRSIQNQNFNEIEMILVNDFSNDNSLKIIEEIRNQDPRIRIMNNNKNMGTLYSRCIGTLISKGKYILALDNDDLFMDSDVFNIVFEEAEKGNYDIIGFKAIRSLSYYKIHISELIDDYLHDHPNNLILYQPELGIFSISRNKEFYLNDIHIWGKCINKKIYVQAINALGKEKYSYFISWAEDTSMIFVIFNFAKSYKFISKYGVLHIMSESTASFTQSNDTKTFGEIFLLNILFDFSKNDYQTKKLVVDKALKIKNYDFFHINNKKNLNFLLKVLKKIIECKFITKKDKHEIIQYFSELNLSNNIFKF